MVIEAQLRTITVLLVDEVVAISLVEVANDVTEFGDVCDVLIVVIS